MSQAFLFLSLFFSVSGSIPDPKKEEPLKLELGKSIEGIYLCRGLDNESKKEYAGVVFVLRKGDGYLVKWNIVGFKEIVGIGMVHGKSLVVGYGYDTEKTVQQAVYVMAIGDGKLSGHWIMLGQRKKNVEEWELLRQLPLK